MYSRSLGIFGGALDMGNSNEIEVPLKLISVTGVTNAGISKN